MKHFLTTLLILTWTAGMGQYQWYFKENNIVTDSIVWRTIDTLRQGDRNCKHEWVYSEEHPFNIGCLVLHHGWHCDWDDMCRDAICRKCRMKISQRQQWYQHEVKPPKSEYECLDEDTTTIDCKGWLDLKGSGFIKAIDSLYYDSTKYQPYYMDTSSLSITPRYDTIPVIMLVCDTTRNEGWIDPYQIVRCMSGYEIRKSYSYLGGPDSNNDDFAYAIAIKKIDHKHIKLLDSNKQPLKPEIIVWDWRRRNP
jgi:hypothetical protein